MKRAVHITAYIVILLAFELQSDTTYGQEDLGFATSIDWNYDSTLIGVSYSSGAYEIIDATTQTVVFSQYNTREYMHQFAWSPTDNRFALASSVGFLTINDGLTGNVITDLSPGTEVDSIAWSHNGQYLAANVRQGTGMTAVYRVMVWDMNTYSPIDDIPVNVGTVLSWSPDDTKLLVGVDAEMTIVVDIGTAMTILSVYDEWFADTLDWSPDGSYFVTGDVIAGLLSVFDLNSGNEILKLEFGSGIYWVEWSPDGQAIAVASGNGLSLVNPFSQQVTSIFPNPTRAVSWNDSGDILVLGGEDGNVTFITSDGTIVTPITCNPSFTIADGDTTALISAITTANGTPEPDTNPGMFSVYTRGANVPMNGRENGFGDYRLENVPYAMYFDGLISLHGTYWHNSFGYRRSRGCVNMTIGDARWLYDWLGEGGQVLVYYSQPY